MLRATVTWIGKRFLHEHRKEGCTVAAMDDASINGHLDVLRFLHEHRKEGCTIVAMNGAACNGHLDVVWFLHEHRTEKCSHFAMSFAASNGQLKVVPTPSVLSNCLVHLGRTRQLDR
jgi:hypothetical protein